MGANAGWVYYRDFFYDIDWKNPESESNSKSIETKVNKLLALNYEDGKFPILGDKALTFTLKTTYPGLLIGSGYAHEGGIKGEMKLGFHFDHTSGLPVIPSSTIKGICKSMFPGKYLKNETEAQNRRLYISQIAKIDENIVDTLENELFNSGLKIEGKTLRDTFYDAVCIKGSPKIYGQDYLTPHKNMNIEKDNMPHEFAEPTPVRFLKVLPNVEFRFDFHFYDGIITAKQKKDLIKQIILDIGLGAKTNVGYGKFTEGK